VERGEPRVTLGEILGEPFGEETDGDNGLAGGVEIARLAALIDAGDELRRLG
jgi:hypothetical protein